MDDAKLDGVVAARAALLFARVVAGVPDSSGKTSVVMNGEPLHGDPATLLADAEKPLTCRARRDAQGLVLACDRAVRNPRAERQRALSFITESDRPIVRNADDKILLVGTGESVWLNLEQFDRFSHDYDLAGTYMWSVRPPDNATRKAGAALVLTVWPATGEASG